MLDFDGVVVDSLEAFSAALIAACARFGIPGVSTVADVVELFAGNVYETLRATGGDDARVVEAVEAAMDGLEPLIPGLTLFPGMPDVVGRLAERRDVVVVTSNKEGLVKGLLAERGVRGVRAVSGFESGLSKREKIAAVRAQYPGQPVYPFVSDTVGDVLEAREAGVVPIGVAWGWHDGARLLAAGAARVVASPADLPGAIDAASGGR